MGKIYCSVVHCHNTTGKTVNGHSVSLHRFPVNQKFRRIWISRVSRRHWQPTTSTRICSEHFNGGAGPTTENPLPTIFPHKKYALSQLSDAVQEITANEENKENESPNSDIELSDHEPVNFCAGDMPTTDTSVHLHDYLGKIDSLLLSRTRHGECQTKPEHEGCASQTDQSGVILSRSSETQTPKTQTVDVGIQVKLPDITVEDLEEDEEFSFYTGLPNKNTFTVLFDSVKQAKSEEEKLKVKTGRPRKLRLIDEFFMLLLRLRLGLLITDLSQRFGIGKTTCSRIVSEWIDFLHDFLMPLVMFPTRDAVRSQMPPSFKRKYPNCRIIIDCTEIFTETPQSLANQSLMYSNYKSHMTWKLLLGISPSGVITFISDLYTGSISDKMITKKSGLIDMLEAGDAVMADKGFLISDILTPKGIYLIIPPKRTSSGPMTRNQVEHTRRVANLRIHVERAMERIKNVRIIQGVIPISLSGQVSKIVRIISALSNMLPPLINDQE